MAKPENSIKKIKLPGENTARDIIPDSLGSNGYIASLPELAADATIATNIDLASKQDKYVLEKIYTNAWSTKTWTGLTSFAGNYSIWTDGENIYYSTVSSDPDLPKQYVLNKTTSSWEIKTWYGLTNFSGECIWTDGENIYYSGGKSSSQYVLNKTTSTWSTKTWSGLTSVRGNSIWTDGDSIYYSYGSNQYVLDKATSTWSAKTWTGLTSFSGRSVWTDGDNVYYSDISKQYILDKSTSTWSTKTWTGANPIQGYCIWTDGTDIYYSYNSDQYVLDKETSTWVAKTWIGLTNFNGDYVWTDGSNIYYSQSSNQFELGNLNSYILLTDLIDEKQHTIDADHKLAADLVDDTASTNKFVTSAEKTAWNNKSDFSGNYADLTNKPDLSIYAESADLANVATSGAYSDLTGVPTNVSAFTNDAGYITSSYHDSTKQDVLTFDEVPTDASNNPVKSNGIYDAIEDIREVAEGKTATYVCSDATNVVLDSQDASISITSALTDINSKSIALADFNIGDNIYVIETDVPDRWVASIAKSGSTVSSVTLNKLETAKVPVNDIQINNTSIITNNVANIITNTAYNASTNKIATMADIEVSSSQDINRLFETEYTITASVTNGTYSGDSTIWSSETAEVTITPNTGYVLPSTITLTGATYTYNSTTGKIELSNATGNVTITIVCEIASGYSGNVDTYLTSSFASTYIKFGSMPTSNDDYDDYVTSGGYSQETNPYSNQTKVYVWGDSSGIKINDVETAGGSSYDNAVEVTLTGNYDIYLKCGRVG